MYRDVPDIPPTPPGGVTEQHVHLGGSVSNKTSSGKAGGLGNVNRSKRLLLLFQEPPKVAGTDKPGPLKGRLFLLLLEQLELL